MLIKRNKLCKGDSRRRLRLDEQTQEQDPYDLFAQFVQVSRVFLAKGKIDNTSKGFASIIFNDKNDVECVSRLGYDH